VQVRASHFSSCPHADEFRQQAREREAAGSHRDTKPANVAPAQGDMFKGGGNGGRR
jgi:hypothetical protein